MGPGGEDGGAGVPSDPDPSSGDPGSGADDHLLDRWMAHREGESTPAPDPADEDLVAYLEPAPEQPQPQPLHERASTPDDRGARAAAPGPAARVDVDFPPRRGTRRVLALALLLMLVATGLAAWSAQRDTNPESLTLAITLGVLTLVTWAIRAGSAQTTLAVHGGQLHVSTGGRRTTFDLTSPYTPIEVIGRPGRRGWKVVFGRGTMRPFTVDAGLVDPHDFMAVLRAYRPE